MLPGFGMIEWITSYNNFLHKAKQLITSQTVFLYSNIWSGLCELKIDFLVLVDLILHITYNPLVTRKPNSMKKLCKELEYAWLKAHASHAQISVLNVTTHILAIYESYDNNMHGHLPKVPRGKNDWFWRWRKPTYTPLENNNTLKRESFRLQG